MYKPEIHETLEECELIENLDFNLKITDGAYQSNHEIEGEFCATFKPTKSAVTNRKSPPRSPVTTILNQIKHSETVPLEGYPGTSAFVAIAGPDSDEHEIVPDTSGIQKDDIIELDQDWELETLKKCLSGNEYSKNIIDYDISGYPSERLPVVVRGNLYDAREMGEKIGLDENTLQQWEGQHVLEITIEHRETPFGANSPLRLDRFQVEMGKTFPNAKFYPSEGTTYDPQEQVVEWSEKIVRPGDEQRYAVRGPIRELRNLEEVSAELVGRIKGTTLSGLSIWGVFDESGNCFNEKISISNIIEAKCTIQIDPDALSGDVQSTTETKISVAAVPSEVYDELINICRREAMEVKASKSTGEAEPVMGRDGVFEVRGKNKGRIKAKKEYQRRGIVYAQIEVTGELTPQSQESRVTTRDESDTKLVRTDEGSLSDHGKSTIHISTRSSNNELNTEFVDTIRNAFPGGGQR